MRTILKEYFGYDDFREGQEHLINELLHHTDVLGIMPTGAGKSLCFQIPAIMLEGVTLVVSPLISLMQDQVNSLVDSGVSAAFINSSLTPVQIARVLENARNGEYKLLYVAPERLLSTDFVDFATTTNISMVTVDEAHCISQWGQDFRPSYAQIPSFINLLPVRPVVSAFTATATTRVKHDIIDILSLQDPTVLVTGFNRENLYFEVSAPKNKQSELTEFLKKHKNKSGIVYCSTRKTVESVCDYLNAYGLNATRYHAGLTDTERKNNQNDFLFDTVQIMVATNAFGMGIDKSNVSFVVHYNMPKDIESYYQEAGRAGRDGSRATCLLLYSGQDVHTNQWMIENAKDTTYTDAETEQELKSREYTRLREITFYSTTNTCLRSYILKYFGEEPPSYCGDCGNCNTKYETVDITVDAQKILSCIYRLNERFGIKTVIDVLRGSQNERILEQGFDKLSTYGISDKSVAMLRSIIDDLLHQGYIEKTEGLYGVLKLTGKSTEILYDKKTIQAKLAIEKIASTNPDTQELLSAETEILFSKLRNIRNHLAQKQGLPSYIVFSDKSITEMCVLLPVTPFQFTKVSGVGQKKLEKYGETFMQEIRLYCEENEIAFPQDEPVTKKKPAKKAAKKNAELVLPNDDMLLEIQLFEKPTQVSTITQEINRVLSGYDCTSLSFIKVGKWLVSEGLLVQEDSNKSPTILGLEKGITQEKRTRNNNEYAVNLFPAEIQQMIINNISIIQTF